MNNRGEGVYIEPMSNSKYIIIINSKKKTDTLNNKLKLNIIFISIIDIFLCEHVNIYTYLLNLITLKQIKINSY